MLHLVAIEASDARSRSAVFTSFHPFPMPRLLCRCPSCVPPLPLPPFPTLQHAPCPGVLMLPQLPPRSPSLPFLARALRQLRSLLPAYTRALGPCCGVESFQVLGRFDRLKVARLLSTLPFCLCQDLILLWPDARQRGQ